MERHVPLAEVKHLLEKSGDDRELNYEQRVSLAHTTSYAKLEHKKAAKLIKELVKFKRVNDYYAVKIADLLPREPGELRAIFMKERYDLTEEEIKEILEAVEKYL